MDPVMIALLFAAVVLVCVVVEELVARHRKAEEERVKPLVDVQKKEGA